MKMAEENNIEISNELIEQVRECQSAEEIQSLACKNGYEITEEQAASIYARLNPENGEVADEELENISGGCSSSTGSLEKKTCPKCGGTMYRYSYYFISAGLTGYGYRCINCEYETKPKY